MLEVKPATHPEPGLSIACATRRTEVSLHAVRFYEPADLTETETSPPTACP